MSVNVEGLREARQRARDIRTGWRLALLQGLVGPAEVLAAAATEDGRALRRMTLRELLSSLPGVSQVQANRMVARLRMLLGVSPEDLTMRRMTVRWLLDSRAAGRAEAWAAAVEGPSTIYDGFPFARVPVP